MMSEFVLTRRTLDSRFQSHDRDHRGLSSYQYRMNLLRFQPDPTGLPDPGYTGRKILAGLDS